VKDDHRTFTKVAGPAGDRTRVLPNERPIHVTTRPPLSVAVICTNTVRFFKVVLERHEFRNKLRTSRRCAQNSNIKPQCESLAWEMRIKLTQEKTARNGLGSRRSDPLFCYNSKTAVFRGMGNGTKNVRGWFGVERAVREPCSTSGCGDTENLACESVSQRDIAYTSTLVLWVTISSTAWWRTKWLST